jgi:hypothetical protein
VNNVDALDSRYSVSGSSFSVASNSNNHNQTPSKDVEEDLRRIEKDVCVVAPICLSHEDIKDTKKEEDLLFI